MSLKVEKFENSFYKDVPPILTSEGLILRDKVYGYTDLFKPFEGDPNNTDRTFGIEYNGKIYVFSHNVNLDPWRWAPNEEMMEEHEKLFLDQLESHKFAPTACLSLSPEMRYSEFSRLKGLDAETRANAIAQLVEPVKSARRKAFNRLELRLACGDAHDLEIARMILNAPSYETFFDEVVERCGADDEQLKDALHAKFPGLIEAQVDCLFGLIRGHCAQAPAVRISEAKKPLLKIFKQLERDGSYILCGETPNNRRVEIARYDRDELSELEDRMASIEAGSDSSWYLKDSEERKGFAAVIGKQASNMSYCMFQNTLSDLRDCFESLNDPTLSPEELSARNDLVELCRRIVDTAENLTDSKYYGYTVEEIEQLELEPLKKLWHQMNADAEDIPDTVYQAVEEKLISLGVDPDDNQFWKLPEA